MIHPFVDSATVPWLVAGDRLITRASPVALSFLCVRPERALGRPFADFVVPEDRPLTEAALERAGLEGSASVPVRVRPRGRSPRARKLVCRRIAERQVQVILVDRSPRPRLDGSSSPPPAIVLPPTGSGLARARLDAIVRQELPRSHDIVTGWLDHVATEAVSADVQLKAVAAVQRQCLQQLKLIEESLGLIDEALGAVKRQR